MVRLNSEDGSSPRAGIFDRFLHKNNQGGSSSGPKKKRARQQQHNFKPDQPRTPTRARGSGMPPQEAPNSIMDIEDLAGLSGDELVQALQDNPELAEKMAQSMPGISGASADGSKIMLQKQGFPYLQWAVTLFLLAAGLYQLRKVLGNSSRSNSGGKASSLSAKKGKKGRRVGGNGPGVRVIDEKLVRELNEVVAKPAQASIAALKKKKKPVKLTTVTPVKNVGDASYATSAAKRPTSDPEPDDDVDDDDVDLSQWQTVSKKANGVNANSKPAIATPAAAMNDAPAPAAEEESMQAKTAQHEELKLNGSSSVPVEANGRAANTTNMSGKKKKKTKKKNGSATDSEASAKLLETTQMAPALTDEELALQLQHAEVAVAGGGGPGDTAVIDEWAEVTKKKRKG